MSKEVYDAQCVFIGSRANKVEHAEATKKVSEKMIKKERDMYKNYQDIEERPVTIQLDEKKCLDFFGKVFRCYYSYFFHNTFNCKKQMLIDKIAELFSQDIQGSMIVFSGNARPKTGDWVIESLDEFNDVEEELISFEEIVELWKKRAAGQKHLLLVIDSNFSGHWMRKLSLLGETSISVQVSCRYWQKSSEDSRVGSYFLHNFYKILKHKKNQDIVEPLHNVQTPGFYGNYHYVYRYFGLKLKYESWSDMRKALGVSPYGNWPRISVKIEGFVVKPDFDSTIKRLKQNDPGFNGNIHGSKHAIPHCYNSKHHESHKHKNQNPRLKSTSPIPISSARHHSNTLKLSEDPNMDEDLKHYVDKNNRKYEGNVDYKGNKQGFGVLYTDKLTVEYEGQFKDDQKSGRGVEYNTDAYKVYEGDFLEDKKNGTGKVFDEDGRVIFHGEFKDDLKHGEGKEFFHDSKIKFHGHYKNGLRNGKGIEYYHHGGKKYEGTWANGQLNGKVTEFDTNDIVRYRGEYNGGQKTGYGRSYMPDGALEYEGEFLDGRFHGKGALYNDLGDQIVEGVFVDGSLQSKTITAYVKEQEIRDKSFDEAKAYGGGVVAKKNTIAGDAKEFLKETLIASVHGVIEPEANGDNSADIKVPEKNSFVLDITTQEIVQLPDKLTIDLANKFMRKATLDGIANRDKNVSSIDRKEAPEGIDRNSIGVSFNFDTPTIHNQVSHENGLKKHAEDKSSAVLLEYSDEFRSHLLDGMKPSMTVTDREFGITQDLPKKNYNPIQNGIVITRKSENSDQFHGEIINNVDESDVIVREKEFSTTSKGKIKDLMKGINRKSSNSVSKQNTENSQAFKDHTFKMNEFPADENHQEDFPKTLHEKPNPLETPIDNFFSYGRPSQPEVPSKKIKDLVPAKKSDPNIDVSREKRSSSSVKPRNISESLKAPAKETEEPSIRKPSFKPQVVVSVDL